MNLRTILVDGLLGASLAIATALGCIALGAATGLTLSLALPATLIALMILELFTSEGPRRAALPVSMVLGAAAVATPLGLLLPALVASLGWREVPVFSVGSLALGAALLGVAIGPPPNATNPAQWPEAWALSAWLRERVSVFSLRATLWGATAVGALVRGASSWLGLCRSSWEATLPLGSSFLFLGVEFSPGLVGLGYLAGQRWTLTLLAGSVVAWWFALPIRIFPWDGQDPLSLAWLHWSTEVRFLGVGALGMWICLQAMRHRQKYAPFGNLRWPWLLTAWALLAGGLWGMSFSPWASGATATGVVLGLTPIAMAARGLASRFGLTLLPLSLLGLLPLCIARLGGSSPALIALSATLALAGFIHASRAQLEVTFPSPWVPWGLGGGALLAAYLAPRSLRSLHFQYGEALFPSEFSPASLGGLLSSLASPVSTQVPYVLPWIAAGAGLVGLLWWGRSKGRISVSTAAFVLGLYLPLGLSTTLALGGIVNRWGPSRERTLAYGAAAGLMTGDALTGVVTALLVTMNPEWVPVRGLDSLLLSVGALGGLLLGLGALAKQK